MWVTLEGVGIFWYEFSVWGVEGWGLKRHQMSFKSIIQDMRGEFGSISRKGFEVKFGYGMRSRSHRVVQDCSLVAIDAFKQSCWANLPPELLRDVLMRIEASEDTWPPRKNVVACAGVCRSWRDIMKEIVRSPEISGKLTFPISLKQVWNRYQLLFSDSTLFVSVASFMFSIICFSYHDIALCVCLHLYHHRFFLSILKIQQPEMRVSHVYIPSY